MNVNVTFTDCVQSLEILKVMLELLLLINIQELRIRIRNMVKSLNLEMKMFAILRKNLRREKSSRNLMSCFNY